MSITVSAAVDAYESHARSLGLADNYIETQMSYLRRFARACRCSYTVPVKRLSPAHVAAFYETLPKTRASHNRALSALRGFTRFLERMNYLKPGATTFLLGDRKTQKFTRKPKYYIPISQLTEMLDAAERRHPADRITLALAFYTLARQGEISGLRLKDLDWEAGTIRIYRPKRKRWTVVQMCPELLTELDMWLGIYAEETDYGTADLMIEENPDWYLAPALDCIKGRNAAGVYDADLTRYEVNPAKQADRLELLVKRMLDQFGALTEDGKRRRHLGEGMHTVRRSGARAMIDHLATVYGEDKALLMVSTMLDHETTTMTLLYIGRNLEQKRLNAFLATSSPYGSPSLEGSNVTRMVLRGSESHANGSSWSDGIPGRVGEVDVL